MKPLLSLLLLLTITAAAYADKNAKPNKVKQSGHPKQLQTRYPYDTATQAIMFNTDTTSTLLPQQDEKQQGNIGWEYDTRVGRRMPVDPSQRLSPFGNNPYQNTTNNPVKPVK